MTGGAALTLEPRDHPGVGSAAADARGTPLRVCRGDSETRLRVRARAASTLSRSWSMPMTAPVG